jgi:hypothetical protein
LVFDPAMFIPIAGQFIAEIDGLLTDPSAAAEAAIEAWIFFFFFCFCEFF